LAAVVHGDADAQGEGGLALLGVAVTDRLSAVGGDTEVGIQPVEGPLGLPHWVDVVVDPVAMVQLVDEVRVAFRPGPDLGVLDIQVGHGVAVGPVVGVELEGFGCQLVLV